MPNHFLPISIRFTFSYSYYIGVAHFGQGTGMILLDNLNCQGSEKDISACGSSGWGHSDCSHSEDVSVICGEYICCSTNVSIIYSVNIYKPLQRKLKIDKLQYDLPRKL